MSANHQPSRLDQMVHLQTSDLPCQTLGLVGFVRQLELPGVHHSFLWKSFDWSGRGGWWQVNLRFEIDRFDLIVRVGGQDLSHRVYLSISFIKSTSTQNSQLIVQ